MSNGWLRLWLLILIRSSNFHVMQKKTITCGCRCSLQMISILQHYKALFRQPDVICTMRLLCRTYFFIKSCLSHTFPRAVQSVTQTERVHLSLPIYGMLFSLLLSPVNITQGWLTAVCWFNATAYFLCRFVSMSAFSGIAAWVNVQFQGPFPTLGHTYCKVSLFPATAEQVQQVITATESSFLQ